MRTARWLPLAAGLAAACGSSTRGPVDADGDGVAAALDCDDSNPAVQATVVAYADADGDGVGAGPAFTLCTDGSAPAGYSLQGTDCAPGDPTRWRAALFVDRDGDGYTAREPGAVCYGASLPDPYRAAASGNDCDDGDPALFRWAVLYRDQDGDGVGAPPRRMACLGASLPSGWVGRGYDPDDLDPAVVNDGYADEILRLID